jgi:hypothetical protein
MIILQQFLVILDPGLYRKAEVAAFRAAYGRARGVEAPVARAFGEDALLRKQKAVHDEICATFMISDVRLSGLWLTGLA